MITPPREPSLKAFYEKPSFSQDIKDEAITAGGKSVSEKYYKKVHL